MSKTAKFAFGLIGFFLVVFVVVISFAVMDAHKTVEKAGIPDTKKGVPVLKTNRSEPPEETADNRGIVTETWDSIAGLVAGQCSVKGKTISLTEKWSVINPRVEGKPLCRIIGYVPPGKHVEYGAEDATPFPAVGWPEEDATSVRAQKGTGAVRFKYSLCPSHLRGKLDWDCSPLRESAQR